MAWRLWGIGGCQDTRHSPLPCPHSRRPRRLLGVAVTLVLAGSALTRARDERRLAASRNKHWYLDGVQKGQSLLQPPWPDPECSLLVFGGGFLGEELGVLPPWRGSAGMLLSVTGPAGLRLPPPQRSRLTRPLIGPAAHPHLRLRLKIRWCFYKGE